MRIASPGLFWLVSFAQNTASNVSEDNQNNRAAIRTCSVEEQNAKRAYALYEALGGAVL
jgi:hypothetical protein